MTDNQIAPNAVYTSNAYRSGTEGLIQRSLKFQTQHLGKSFRYVLMSPGFSEM